MSLELKPVIEKAIEEIKKSITLLETTAVHEVEAVKTWLETHKNKYISFLKLRLQELKDELKSFGDIKHD